VLVVRRFLPVRRPPCRELLIGFLASTDRRPDVEPVIVEDAQPDGVPRLLEIRHAAFARHAPAAYSPEEVATRLLGHVEADFRTRTGATRIEVGVALHAEPFYRARGYQLVRRAQAWDGSAYLEMIRSL
jgi:hypothetical protein